MAIADASLSAHTTTSHDEARVSLQRIAALYRINAAMMQATTELHVLQIAANGLVEQAGYLNVWICTVDRAAHMLRGRAGAGTGMYEQAITKAYSLDEELTFIQAVRLQQSFIVEDAVAVADAEGWGDIARKIGLKSGLYVPFGNATESIGVIAVSTKDVMQLDEEVTLINLFGSQLSTALSKIKYDAERAQQIVALQQATIAQERLLETVRELSTPAIPIHDGILVLPLVGNIDSGRASQVMEAVLEGIAREHAAVVIVDVTGVPVIDTGVANHLVQVTQAAQLLGARALLVGIKPEVAQTLVQLGVDLRSIATRSDLRAGVAYALEQCGMRVVNMRG